MTRAGVSQSRSRSLRTVMGTWAVVGALGLLSACSSGDTPANQVTVTPEATASKSAVPAPELPTVWPLTGVASDDIKDRPAVAVKIENTNLARPQYGLEDADVVWETIVEFDVSRYIAVFHSKYPKEVGPVRSVRPMDVRVVSPLKGVFIYSGGQPGILKLVKKNTNIQAYDETSGASAMWRTPTRHAPHNLNGDVSKFAKLAQGDNTTSPAEQFQFAADAKSATAVSDGKEATNISMKLSSAAAPSWKWDDKENAWKRSEGSTPAMVASGEQISATNLVVITARHFDSGYDAQNNAPVPDYDLDGSGKAIIATGGKTIEGKWTKKDNNSPLLLVDDEGQPITLAPGNTWVEMVPKGSGSVTVE